MAAGYRTQHGIFKPLNPHKYRGNAKQIVYRSSWELKAMMKFDKDVRIEWWSSEEIMVPYYNPAKQREARYFPDFVIGIRQSDLIITTMIEVKPHSQCRPPNKPKTNRKSSQDRFITETLTYAQNAAKWEAARKFCDKHGWNFLIIDEYHLGIKKRPNA